MEKLEQVYANPGREKGRQVGKLHRQLERHEGMDEAVIRYVEAAIRLTPGHWAGFTTSFGGC